MSNTDIQPLRPRRPICLFTDAPDEALSKLKESFPDTFVVVYEGRDNIQADIADWSETSLEEQCVAIVPFGNDHSVFAEWRVSVDVSYDYFNGTLAMSKNRYGEVKVLPDDIVPKALSTVQ